MREREHDGRGGQKLTTKISAPESGPLGMPASGPIPRRCTKLFNLSSTSMPVSASIQISLESWAGRALFLPRMPLWLWLWL